MVTSNDISHIFLEDRGRADPVAATRLSNQPNVERFRGNGAVGVEIESTTTTAPEPSPFPHQSHIAKQCRFDREYIEASQIAATVSALEDQDLQLVDSYIVGLFHRSVFAIMSKAVQRKVGIDGAETIRESDRSDGADAATRSAVQQDFEVADVASAPGAVVFQAFCSSLPVATIAFGRRWRATDHPLPSEDQVAEGSLGQADMPDTAARMYFARPQAGRRDGLQDIRHQRLCTELLLEHGQPIASHARAVTASENQSRPSCRDPFATISNLRSVSDL